MNDCLESSLKDNKSLQCYKGLECLRDQMESYSLAQIYSDFSRWSFLRPMKRYLPKMLFKVKLNNIKSNIIHLRRVHSVESLIQVPGKTPDSPNETEGKNNDRDLDTNCMKDFDDNVVSKMFVHPSSSDDIDEDIQMPVIGEIDQSGHNATAAATLPHVDAYESWMDEDLMLTVQNQYDAGKSNPSQRQEGYGDNQPSNDDNLERFDVTHDDVSDHEATNIDSTGISGPIASFKSAFCVGDHVKVDARTSPGMNKLGGVGKIVKVTYRESEDDYVYSVKYFVETGTESNIEEKYIHPSVQLTTSQRREIIKGRCSVCNAFVYECLCPKEAPESDRQSRRNANRTLRSKPDEQNNHPLDIRRSSLYDEDHNRDSLEVIEQPFSDEESTASEDMELSLQRSNKRARLVTIKIESNDESEEMVSSRMLSDKHEENSHPNFSQSFEMEKLFGDIVNECRTKSQAKSIYDKIKFIKGELDYRDDKFIQREGLSNAHKLPQDLRNTALVHVVKLTQGDDLLQLLQRSYDHIAIQLKAYQQISRHGQKIDRKMNEMSADLFDEADKEESQAIANDIIQLNYQFEVERLLTTRITVDLVKICEDKYKNIRKKSDNVFAEKSLKLRFDKCLRNIEFQCDALSVLESDVRQQIKSLRNVFEDVFYSKVNDIAMFHDTSNDHEAMAISDNDSEYDENRQSGDSDLNLGDPYHISKPRAVRAKSISKDDDPHPHASRKTKYKEAVRIHFPQDKTMRKSNDSNGHKVSGKRRGRRIEGDEMDIEEITRTNDRISRPYKQSTLIPKNNLSDSNHIRRSYGKEWGNLLRYADQGSDDDCRFRFIDQENGIALVDYGDKCSAMIERPNDIRRSSSYRPNSNSDVRSHGPPIVRPPMGAIDCNFIDHNQRNHPMDVGEEVIQQEGTIFSNLAIRERIDSNLMPLPASEDIPAIIATSTTELLVFQTNMTLSSPSSIDGILDLASKQALPQLDIPSMPSRLTAINIINSHAISPISVDRSSSIAGVIESVFLRMKHLFYRIGSVCETISGRISHAEYERLRDYHNEIMQLLVHINDHLISALNEFIARDAAARDYSSSSMNYRAIFDEIVDSLRGQRKQFIGDIMILFANLPGGNGNSDRYQSFASFIASHPKSNIVDLVVCMVFDYDRLFVRILVSLMNQLDQNAGPHANDMMHFYQRILSLASDLMYEVFSVGLKNGNILRLSLVSIQSKVLQACDSIFKHQPSVNSNHGDLDNDSRGSIFNLVNPLERLGRFGRSVAYVHAYHAVMTLIVDLQLKYERLANPRQSYEKLFEQSSWRYFNLLISFLSMPNQIVSQSNSSEILSDLVAGSLTNYNPNAMGIVTGNSLNEPINDDKVLKYEDYVWSMLCLHLFCLNQYPKHTNESTNFNRIPNNNWPFLKSFLSVQVSNSIKMMLSESSSTGSNQAWSLQRRETDENSHYHSLNRLSKLCRVWSDPMKGLEACFVVIDQILSSDRLMDELSNKYINPRIKQQTQRSHSKVFNELVHEYCSEQSQLFDKKPIDIANDSMSLEAVQNAIDAIDNKSRIINLFRKYLDSENSCPSLMFDWICSTGLDSKQVDTLTSLIGTISKMLSECLDSILSQDKNQISRTNDSLMKRAIKLSKLTIMTNITKYLNQNHCNPFPLILILHISRLANHRIGLNLFDDISFKYSHPMALNLNPNPLSQPQGVPVVGTKSQGLVIQDLYCNNLIKKIKSLTPNVSESDKSNRCDKGLLFVYYLSIFGPLSSDRKASVSEKETVFDPTANQLHRAISIFSLKCQGFIDKTGIFLNFAENFVRSLSKGQNTQMTSICSQDGPVNTLSDLSLSRDDILLIICVLIDVLGRCNRILETLVECKLSNDETISSNSEGMLSTMTLRLIELLFELCGSCQSNAIIDNANPMLSLPYAVSCFASQIALQSMIQQFNQTDKYHQRIAALDVAMSNQQGRGSDRGPIETTNQRENKRNDRDSLANWLDHHNKALQYLTNMAIYRYKSHLMASFRSVMKLLRESLDERSFSSLISLSGVKSWPTHLMSSKLNYSIPSNDQQYRRDEEQWKGLLSQRICELFAQGCVFDYLGTVYLSSINTIRGHKSNHSPNFNPIAKHIEDLLQTLSSSTSSGYGSNYSAALSINLSQQSKLSDIWLKYHLIHSICQKIKQLQLFPSNSSTNRPDGSPSMMSSQRTWMNITFQQCYKPLCVSLIGFVISNEFIPSQDISKPSNETLSIFQCLHDIMTWNIQTLLSIADEKTLLWIYLIIMLSRRPIAVENRMPAAKFIGHDCMASSQSVSLEGPSSISAYRIFYLLSHIRNRLSLPSSTSQGSSSARYPSVSLPINQSLQVPSYRPIDMNGAGTQYHYPNDSYEGIINQIVIKLRSIKNISQTIKESFDELINHVLRVVSHIKYHQSKSHHAFDKHHVEAANGLINMVMYYSSEINTDKACILFHEWIHPQIVSFLKDYSRLSYLTDISPNSFSLVFASNIQRHVPLFIRWISTIAYTTKHGSSWTSLLSLLLCCGSYRYRSSRDMATYHHLLVSFSIALSVSNTSDLHQIKGILRLKDQSVCENNPRHASLVGNKLIDSQIWTIFEDCLDVMLPILSPSNDVDDHGNIPHKYASEGSIDIFRRYLLRHEALISKDIDRYTNNDSLSMPCMNPLSSLCWNDAMNVLHDRSKYIDPWDQDDLISEGLKHLSYNILKDLRFYCNHFVYQMQSIEKSHQRNQYSHQLANHSTVNDKDLLNGMPLGPINGRTDILDPRVPCDQTNICLNPSYQSHPNPMANHPSTISDGPMSSMPLDHHHLGQMNSPMDQRLSRDQREIVSSKFSTISQEEMVQGMFFLIEDLLDMIRLCLGDSPMTIDKSLSYLQSHMASNSSRNASNQSRDYSSLDISSKCYHFLHERLTHLFLAISSDMFASRMNEDASAAINSDPMGYDSHPCSSLIHGRETNDVALIECDYNKALYAIRIAIRKLCELFQSSGPSRDIIPVNAVNRLATVKAIIGEIFHVVFTKTDWELFQMNAMIDGHSIHGNQSHVMPSNASNMNQEINRMIHGFKKELYRKMKCLFDKLAVTIEEFQVNCDDMKPVGSSYAGNQGDRLLDEVIVSRIQSVFRCPLNRGSNCIDHLLTKLSRAL